MDYILFNQNFGYLEGIVRGLRAFILTKNDYSNLVQSETLEDIKLNLMTGDYVESVSNLVSPITVASLEEKLKEKLVKEFFYFKANSCEPLSTFLDYITYSYMIDNICLLISGVIHGRPTSELLSRCHPLGMFEQIHAMEIINTTSELYNVILVDTPLAPFFSSCVSEDQFDEMHVEIIRSSVYKIYIESFYCFCENIGGITFEVMKPILQFEADRRCFSITINSLGTYLNKEERAKFFPTCGELYPDGCDKLAKVDNFDQIRLVAEFYPQYELLFSETNTIYTGKTIEDRFFEYEVKIHANTFFHQFNFAVFYSYIKLLEQQNRNITWISECIAQRNKKQIDEYIKIF